MTINILSILIVPVFICTLSYAADGGNTVYTVGVEDVNYAPHYAFGKDRNVAEDILNDFSKENKITLIFKPMSIGQLYWSLLTAETIDFKYPDHPTWGTDIKRDAPMYYSKGVVDYVDGVVMLPDSSVRYINQLKVIGALRGFTLVPYLDLVEKHNISILRANDFENLIQALLKGRVDGVYANIDVIRQKVSELHGDNTKVYFNYKLPYQRSNYRLSTKKYPVIIRKLDKYFKKYSDRIDLIKEKYGVENIDFISQ